MRDTKDKRRSGFETGLAFWGLMVAVVLVLGGGAWKTEKPGGGGDLLWADQFNNGGSNNAAQAITVNHNRVFAGGFGETEGGALDGVVRAYEAKTGALLWADQFNYGGGTNNCVSVITVQGRRVFAAGQGETAGGVFVGVVRAYEARTGALLWDDQWDNGGQDNGVRGITVQGTRVFAAGYGQTAGGVIEWVVRAYEARTGALLWADQWDNGGELNVSFAITVQGTRVFVAGFGETAGGVIEWVVRAYDTGTGALLWADQWDNGGEESVARAITVQGNRVFVSGFGNIGERPCTVQKGFCEWVVRAYEARTGALLWDDQFDLGGGENDALAITVQGTRVFAAGFGKTAGGVDVWVVRAYEAKTGTLLWEDQFDKGGDNIFAFDITVKGNRVFAAGGGLPLPTLGGASEWVVRAYEAKTGVLLWDDQFDQGGTFNAAQAITVERNRVFAAGVLTEGGVGEWVVRAYSSR